MRIVVAGGSGFLGTALRQRLHADGHEVVQLVRSEPQRPDEVRWYPDQRELDPVVLGDADAVVNLAGAGAADRRWNEAYKRTLRSSRLDPTATIATALAEMPQEKRPRALLNASAVGFYGDTGDMAVDEDSPPGEGYFADLCEAWEAATRPAQQAGVRVVRLRTGLVLQVGGGLLRPIATAFRLYAGGRLASGRQWMPWISLDDWVSAVMFLLERDDISGPVNLVAPNPVRNEEFTRALARALHRPAVLPVPKPVLRLLLGEFAEYALMSQRVLPARLQAAGFVFTHPTLDSALPAALAPRQQ